MTSKLKVMKKKFYEFLKEKIVSFYMGDAKHRVFGKGLPPALKRATRENPWWGRLDDKTWLSMFRYLNLSMDSKLNQNMKVHRVFWKVLSPQLSREKRKSSAVLCEVKNGSNFPKLSRGIKKQVESPSGRPEPKLPDNKRLEEGKTSEKNLRPKEPLPLKCRSEIKKKKEEGRTFIELPPPQRCKLSCPLPPIDSIQFLPSDQPPPFRFPFRHSEFFPETTEKLAKPDLTAASSLPESSLKNTDADIAPKMKALLFEPTTLELSCSEVIAPSKIFKDEVLVQVSYSGVRSLDLIVTEGKVLCGNDAIILGQEISGTVYAVGSDVHHVRMGDRVTVDSFAGCSKCCSKGFEFSWENDGVRNPNGVPTNGGWAEFVTVKKNQVHKVPDELALDQAVLVLLLSRILSALSRLKLSYGIKILVQGLGWSGKLWASVLHSRGFKNVLVSDRSEVTKQQFESLGLNYEFVAPEDVRKLSFDLVIECTGSPASIERSFDVLNANGQMCFFGRADPFAEIRCLPHEIARKEITITGSAGNSSFFSEAIDVAATMGRRYLDLEKLGAKMFDLNEFNHAFQMVKSGQVGKIIFKLES